MGSAPCEASLVQAARGLPVYRCLVEGCTKVAASPAHRRQHLLDAHHFPSNYDCSRLHLMVHRAEKARPQQAAEPDADMRDLGSAFNRLHSGAASGRARGSRGGRHGGSGRGRGQLDLRP